MSKSSYKQIYMKNMKSGAKEVVNNSTGVRAFDVLRRYISAMGQRSPKNEPRKMLVKMCRSLLRDERRIVKRINQIEHEISLYENEAAKLKQTGGSLMEKN